MYAMAAAASESEPQAAGDGEPTPTGAAATARPPATLDPRLFMAARRGDSKQLKNLLMLPKDDGQQEQRGTSDSDGISGSAVSPTTTAGSSVAGAQDVIVEVHPRPPHEAVAPPSSRFEDGVTTAGNSLSQHVVDGHAQVDIVEAADPRPDDAVARLPSPSAASSGDRSFPPVPVLDEDGVTREGDSLLHVVAACGDDGDFLRCAEMIYDKANRLLVARNTKGDTPLHCAASAGNANMISCLIFLADRDVETSVEALVRMRNECGETALHQAVCAPHNNKACIDRLMDADSDLACIPHDEEGGASPLYLAISLGEVEIARHLLRKTKGMLSYCGPDGSNVLHAAVCRGQGQVEALPMVLAWLRAVADMRQRQAGQEGHADLHLLSQLTSQRDKENGSTPLHLAAGGSPTPVMYKTHPYFWRWTGSAARLLLDTNVSTAYQADKKGLYPIHVAAGADCLPVVKILLERCPECATLRDANGRTFLHVAVEEGWYRVVKYVCEQSKRRHHAGAGLLSSILNAQDINGDTALHRAVRAGNLSIFNCLVRNQRVRLDVKNKEGMRPIDVAWSKMPLKVYYAWDPRTHIRKYLLKVGAPYGESRGDLFHQRYILPKQDEDKMSENLTAAAQVLGLFSVLMTTATFASAFTLPGGYRSAGDGGGVAGTPVLAGPRRSYAFDAFVLSNALAFLCSLYATSLLLYAGVPHGTLTGRFATINAAYTFMWQAGRCLLAAFALGLYVVLFPVARTIAIAVLVLVGITAVGFLKNSEGIHSMIVIGRRGRIQSIWDFLLFWIIYALDHFWSYIIIFGLPAIHKWAKLP